MAIAIRDVTQGKGLVVAASLGLTAFAVDPVNGDTVVVCCATYSQVPTITISDSTGSNTYGVVTGINQSGLLLSMFVANNIVGGASFVVSVNVSTATSYVSAVAYCLSGCASSAYNGDSRSAYLPSPGTGTDAVTTGTTSPTPVANSLAITMMADSGPSNNGNPGTGWSSTANGVQGNNSVYQSLYTEYQTVSAVYAGTYTLGTDAGLVLVSTASFAPPTSSVTWPGYQSPLGWH